jgi:hypothetical protein
MAEHTRGALTRRARRLVVGALVLTTVALAGVSGAARAGTPPSVALLTDVQVADHGTFDRVTFVFEGGVPEVLQAEYFSGPVSLTPSGEPLVPPLLGSARFMLTLSNASGVDLSMDPFVDTYPGPDRIQPGLPGLVDLALVGDFEATMNWAFGLPDGEVPAEVRVESSPTRVVVDIPHPAPRAIVARPTFTG